MNCKLSTSKFCNYKRMVFLSCFAIGLLSLLTLTVTVNDVKAQGDNVTINTTKLSNNTYMLKIIEL